MVDVYREPRRVITPLLVGKFNRSRTQFRIRVNNAKVETGKVGVEFFHFGGKVGEARGG